MVAISESQRLTARQAKRKDWWKVRRAKLKTQDGSTDGESVTPDGGDGNDTVTDGADVSTGPVSIVQDSAKVKTEKDIALKTEDVAEKTETLSGKKQKRRKVSSAAEKTEVLHQGQEVKGHKTPKESKAAKRRKRLQKLHLYRSQKTSSVVKITSERLAKSIEIKSESEEKILEKTIATIISPRTRAATTLAGELEGNDNDSQQPKQKKKKGKVPKLYIAFVGNLPYSVKVEDLKWHFNKEGGVKAVRLLTSKDTAKPRGCAFVEFVDNASLMRGVDLHHSQLGWRTINVEVSTGGKKKKGKGQSGSRGRTKSRDGHSKTANDNSSSNETQSDA